MTLILVGLVLWQNSTFSSHVCTATAFGCCVYVLLSTVRVGFQQAQGLPPGAIGEAPRQRRRQPQGAVRGHQIETRVSARGIVFGAAIIAD